MFASGIHRSHRRRTLAGRRALRRHARARSSICSSRSSSTTSCGPRRSASSARCGSACLDAADRAARAVGRVGWRALRQRQGARAQAAPGPAAEGAAARAGARGARPAVRPVVPRRRERLSHGHQVTAQAGRGDEPGYTSPRYPSEPRPAAVNPSATLARRGRLAQLARAPPLQGGGRGFETLNAHRDNRRSEAISPSPGESLRFPSIILSINLARLPIMGSLRQRSEGVWQARGLRRARSVVREAPVCRTDDPCPE